jgi:hypothetical protein
MLLVGEVIPFLGHEVDAPIYGRPRADRLMIRNFKFSKHSSVLFGQ